MCYFFMQIYFSVLAFFLNICIQYFRDQRNGTVLVRCSQPELGFFGWRSTEDETMLESVPVACSQNPGTYTKYPGLNDDLSGSESGSQNGGLYSLWIDHRMTIKHVIRVQNILHYHLIKYNVFLPWYSWKIAHLALNNNHSLIHDTSFYFFTVFLIFFLLRILFLLLIFWKLLYFFFQEVLFCCHYYL